MFNNLIESTSHKEEMRRRGSFILGTMVVYGLMALALGVASIYAYDAHLDNQNADVVALVMPVFPGDTIPTTIHQTPASGTTTNNHSPVDIHRELIADVNHSQLAPQEISTKPSDALPVRPGLPQVTGGREDRGGGIFVGGGPGVTGGALPAGTSKAPVVHIDTPPPPAPVKPQTPPVKTIVKKTELLNSQAVSLPKPLYPEMAKRIRIAGSVSVQVLLDETGKVISAHAVSGHPLLQSAAVQAAYQARFTPTILGGVPMKVSGVINYNFVLQ